MQNLTEKVARLASEAEPVAVPRPKRTNRWQHLHTLAQVWPPAREKLVLHLTGI